MSENYLLILFFDVLCAETKVAELGAEQVSKRFKPYDMNQPILFETDIRDWLPSNHIAHFISDIIETADLSKIYDKYKTGAGKPGYDPRLLLKLLILGYSKGIRSSRRIESATYDNVAFRVLATDNHPDHDTIANFRTRHLEAFSSIFLQVLELCKKAGLLKCQHISLDGTKIKANAKKSKSRKYQQLQKTKEELEQEVADIIKEAEEVDREEDKQYGKGVKGDKIPDVLQDKRKRQALISELLEKMKEEAKEKQKQYPKKKEERKQEDDEWLRETGEKIESRPPLNPTGKAVEKIIESRRNPTDYDSRVMKDGMTGGYIQAYNCQAAVDADSQVIVSADVYTQPNDKQLSVPMLSKAIENSGNITPDFFTADNGYYSERDIVKLEKMGVDPYIPPTKTSKGKRHVNTANGRRTITEYMRDKLLSKTGHSIYKLRKTITEPVFGQIKEHKSFRTFLLRGLSKVQAEWQLMAIAHNIGKLHLNRC